MRKLKRVICIEDRIYEDAWDLDKIQYATKGNEYQILYSGKNYVIILDDNKEEHIISYDDADGFMLEWDESEEDIHNKAAI